MGWLKTTLKIMVESLLWTATCIATLLAAITLWLQFSTLSLVPIAGAIENMLEARIGGKIHLLNPRLGWSQTSNDFTFALDRIYYVDDVLGVKMLADNIFAKHNMDAVLENGVWSAASIFRIEGVHIYGENGTVLRSQITEALFALSALEGDGLRYIDDFTISNINFIQADIDGESEPSHLILRRTGDTLTANGKIAFPAHDGYKPTLMMAGRIGVGVGGQIAINISDASTSAIADWGQGLALLKVVEARGNVSAIVRINADLRPTTGEFDMNLGAGQVHLPFTPPSFIPEKMTLHKAHLVMDVDFATEVLRMSVGKVSLDKSELDLQGRFTYAQDNVGGLSVRGQITNGTAHLDMADILTAPLQLRDVKADATYDYANTIFRIDHLSANDERNRRIATLVGELAVKPHKQSTLQVDLDIGAIDGENIMDRWSPLLAGNTRKWARENLSGGRLVGAHLKMNVLLNTLITKPRRAPLPEGAVHLQMYFEDMRLNYIDDMPPLQEATGKIDVYGKTMFVALKSGKVILQNNKDPIIIGASTLFMDDYRDPDRNSILEIGLKGQSKTIMRYINLPPVFATRNVDFDFSRLEGDMAGRVKMYLPIKPDIDRDAIRFTASAQSTNAAITGKIDDYTISAGQVYTTIDNQYFSMQGNIEANGVPLTLAWHLPVALPEKSQLALSGAIDKADMIALEQGDWANHINENAWLNLLVEGLMTAPDHYRFDIDLTDTEFIPRPLAYKKAVGVAASLKGRVNLAPNQDWQKLIFRYDDEVTTPINGILTFTDRKLESLTLPPITMGQTRDLLIKFAK
ncbi:MAG: hypothetical protein HAW64_02015, partial [Alphaproteobacteria bacterium]|nr:hypothetical protein [Alphaproteobacteria bacterium]